MCTRVLVCVCRCVCECDCKGECRETHSTREKEESTRASEGVGSDPKITSCNSTVGWLEEAKVVELQQRFSCFFPTEIGSLQCNASKGRRCMLS